MGMYNYGKEGSETKKYISVALIIIIGVYLLINLKWDKVSGGAIYDKVLYFVYMGNLAVHESGHAVLQLLHFPEFIVFLAGELFQTMLPLLLAIFFYIKRRGLEYGIAVMWLGESLTEVGQYMYDALYQIKPLLIPNGMHDWVYMFNRMGCLNKAHAIGMTTHYVGIFIIIVGIISGVMAVLINENK